MLVNAFSFQLGPHPWTKSAVWVPFRFFPFFRFFVFFVFVCLNPHPQAHRSPYLHTLAPMMAAPTAQAHEATETTATRITEEAKDALRAYFSTLDVVRTSKLPRKGASEVLDNIIISHASLTREKAGWQLRKYKIE